MPAAEIDPRDHLGLIVDIVSRYARPGPKFDDLSQEGAIGLLDAIADHDPLRGPFHAYAALCIRHRVLLALRDYDRPVRLPSNVHAWGSLVRREKLVPGDPAGPDEEYLRRGLHALSACTLRDGDDDGGSDFLIDGLPGGRDETPAEIALRRLFVAQLLDCLPRRERDVVVAQHGLDGGPPRSYREIARAIGGGNKDTVRLTADRAHRRMRLYAWRDTGGARTADDTPMRGRA